MKTAKRYPFKAFLLLLAITFSCSESPEEIIKPIDDDDNNNPPREEVDFFAAINIYENTTHFVNNNHESYSPSSGNLYVFVNRPNENNVIASYRVTSKGLLKLNKEIAGLDHLYKDERYVITQLIYDPAKDLMLTQTQLIQAGDSLSFFLKQELDIYQSTWGQVNLSNASIDRVKVQSTISSTRNNPNVSKAIIPIRPTGSRIFISNTSKDNKLIGASLSNEILQKEGQISFDVNLIPNPWYTQLINTTPFNSSHFAFHRIYGIPDVTNQRDFIFLEERVINPLGGPAQAFNIPGNIFPEYKSIASVRKSDSVWSIVTKDFSKAFHKFNPSFTFSLNQGAFQTELQSLSGYDLLKFEFELSASNGKVVKSSIINLHANNSFKLPEITIPGTSISFNHNSIVLKEIIAFDDPALNSMNEVRRNLLTGRDITSTEHYHFITRKKFN